MRKKRKRKRKKKRKKRRKKLRYAILMRRIAAGLVRKKASHNVS